MRMALQTLKLDWLLLYAQFTYGVTRRHYLTTLPTGYSFTPDNTKYFDTTW